MAKFEFSVSLGLVGCRKREIVEIDDEELEDLSGDEQVAYLESYMQDWLPNHVDWGWDLKDDPAGVVQDKAK